MERPTNTAVLDRCREQLTQLQAQRADVCAVLREVSAKLLETGQPPAPGEIEQIRQFQARFQLLAASVTSERSQAGSKPQSESSLNNLREELDLQIIVQASIARLDQIARITHVEQAEFLPWKRCLDDATKLRDQLLSTSASAPTRRAAAEQILGPKAPLGAIASLVSEGSDLSDERWSTLIDMVSAAYGREITTAIARGKLLLMSGNRA